METEVDTSIEEPQVSFKGSICSNYYNEDSEVEIDVTPILFSAAACYDEGKWAVENLMDPGTDACVFYMSYGAEDGEREYGYCHTFGKAGGGNMREDFFQRQLDNEYGGELPEGIDLDWVESMLEEYGEFEAWAWVDGEEDLTAPTKNYDLEQRRAEPEEGAESLSAFWLAAGGSAILTATLYGI